MTDSTRGPLTEDTVRALLRRVSYPGLSADIVSLGLLRSVSVRDGSIHVELALKSERPEIPEQVQTAVETALRHAGATHFEVLVGPPERRTFERDPRANRGRLCGVGRVLAVGAGKGGVGKSTVAVNLAFGLRDLGLKVGLLDADIYGPSVPVLVGLEDGAKHVRMTSDRKIVPLEISGLHVVSFGFFLGAGSPAVWRGPMVAKAVTQTSRGVLWPPLDVLVVDLPPGTGDVPLSLTQSIVVDGAVVVTTPQRLAVQEAQKAAEMFGKLEVPVLGLVENMSFATCACGRRSYPFGQGGGALLAHDIGVDLLGQVPFEESTVEAADAGRAVIEDRPAGATAKAFRTIAILVADRFALETAIARPQSRSASRL